jgi:membrane-associated protease RseP (regulator of RpoE activity)
MPDYYSEPTFSYSAQRKPAKAPKRYLLHLSLFLVTFVTTLIAGMEWTTGKMGPYELDILFKGLPYALSILFIIGVHEFGHYFASLYHKVDATLPFFIPFPPIPGFFHFGTMGAIIKTRTRIPDNKAMFDIGVSGPIAGFIACVIVLVYGFTHLPGTEYILSIHPDYFSPEYGKNALGLEFGNTLLFASLKELLTSPRQFVPPMSEIYHYPYLCVGWFGLFITSMNLIPVGQLDGGHVIYSMFGYKNHERIASVAMIILVVLGVIGGLELVLGYDLRIGWMGWLFWALILFFVIKVKHPPVMTFKKLNTSRMIIGFIAILIFILSFSPLPFVTEGLM